MRGASLGIAAAISVIGLVFPFLLARQATGLNQSVLLVMVAGAVGAFIYGAGFTPHRAVLRIAITPWVTFPAMLGSCIVLIAMR